MYIPIATSNDGINPIQMRIVVIAEEGCPTQLSKFKQLLVETYPANERSIPSSWTLNPIPSFWIKTIHAV